MADIYKFTHSIYTTNMFKNYNEYNENLETEEFSVETEDNLFDMPVVKTRDSEMYSSKHPKWTFDKSLYTEEDFVENYGNPMASVNIYRPTVVVTKDDKKVAIKFFEYQRTRMRGKPYFRVSTKVKYITFNYITHSLYSGHIINYHKKRKFTKRVKRNCFYDGSLNGMLGVLSNMVRFVLEKTPELLINNTVVNDVITHFIDNIPNTEKYKMYTPNEVLFKLYLDGHKIKSPNNWNTFVNIYPQPKKKDYVKHKLKFMDAFMFIHGLQGDKIKRVLHKVTDIKGLEFFKFTNDFFGKEFMASQDDKLIQDIVECNLYINGGMTGYLKNLSKREKNNSFEVFKQVLRGDVDINTYYDHFRMINQLRQFEPVKWDAKDYDSFTNEHMVLSDKISFYTKGTFERIYGEEFTNRVQEPLNIDGVTYYPVLLKTSEEYNMESFIQSNCVKGYVDRAPSLIISFREGSQDSKVRATIEFTISEENKLKRIQTLGRFNKGLDDEWKKPLIMLDLKIGKLMSAKLFELPGVILKIGYKEFKSGSHFVDKPHYLFNGSQPTKVLDWEDPRINNRPTNNYGNLPFPQILEEPLPLLENDLD
jgi:hypothetical protein